MKTKQEERNILEQIAKLIAEAGEDSYIATAFSGCVNIAYQNIENDWACSHEATIAQANKNIEQLSARIRELEAENANLLELFDDVVEQRNEAKAKIYPKQLVQEIFHTMCERSQEATNTITRTAELIANYADNPTDIAVIDGLKMIKRATKQRNDAERIMDEIRKYA